MTGSYYFCLVEQQLGKINYNTVVSVRNMFPFLYAHPSYFQQ